MYLNILEKFSEKVSASSGNVGTSGITVANIW